MNLVVCPTLLLLFKVINCSLTTTYYEELLTQKFAETQNYELPQSANEFEEAVESTETIDFGQYDFIIVGAGSAGSVLATRLSEINDWNILLLEAGGEENDFNQIPFLTMYQQFTDLNWGFLSTPQTNCCLGMKDNKCMAPRGKVIGGSSSINALLYVRGNPIDYDKWVELGNLGWSYEELLPYFLKSENAQIEDDPGYHHKGGFWNVEYALPPSDTLQYFLEGNAELNINFIDYNGKTQRGVSKSQVNTKHGKRHSTGTAFLNKARKRKNLKVITKALVTKIVIDKNLKIAQGVEFVTNKAKFVASAKKEVLLSAGAFNSPQLLILSGVGPKEHLEELNIDIIEDLPVGENLIEHPVFHGLIFRTNYTYTENNLTYLIEQYLNGLGPLTSPLNVDGLGFFYSENNPKNVPLAEYIFMPPNINLPPILDKGSNFNEELTENFASKIDPTTDIIFFVVLLHPNSRGRVTLKSNNPTDFPNIDFNMFSHPDDITDMIEAIEFILKLSKTNAFQKLNATLLEIPICQDKELYSKDFWDCAIRHVAMTTYHASGTTTMGPDKTRSVVNTDLKVHGIENLRVVDAGVIPWTISGHTNAPVIMLAEKISDAIKLEHS